MKTTRDEARHTIDKAADRLKELDQKCDTILEQINDLERAYRFLCGRAQDIEDRAKELALSDEELGEHFRDAFGYYPR